MYAAFPLPGAGSQNSWSGGVATGVVKNFGSRQASGSLGSSIKDTSSAKVFPKAALHIIERGEQKPYLCANVKVQKNTHKVIDKTSEQSNH